MPIGINYIAGVSAQLKSAVILAGLNSFGNTKLLKDLKVEIIQKICFKNLKSIKIKKYKKKNVIKVFLEKGP